MHVKWTNTALQNLDNVLEFIAKDRPATAREVGHKIWDSANKLGENPGIGRPGRVPETRELIISGLPFILPYIEKEDSVYILRVMHTSLKWPKSF